MLSASTPRARTSLSDVQTMLRELRGESIWPALPAIGLSGLVLIANAERFSDPLCAGLPSMILVLLAFAAWALHSTSESAAAGLLVVGCLIVDLLVVAWGGVDAAICLAALPIAFACLTIGIGAAVSLALAYTLLLYIPVPILPLDATLRAVAVTGVWGTVALVWLTMRPLLTTVRWSWSGYTRSRHLLEVARDYQAQLKQAMADLADANGQLVRLNRLADGLRQAAEEARQAKQQFVANVSHELRTPLNMIIGFSEMILRAPESYGGSIPTTLLADLDVIFRNSEHLSELVDDVLDLSQIERGQLTLSKEAVSLHEVIDTASAAVRPLYDSKVLSLEAEVPDDLPLVPCDGTRVRQVVLNLLSNAGRYTERGGVRVRAYRHAGDVVVSVSDTGPGIAAEDMGKLFQPFHQLDGSLRRRHGGTGLGLYISRNLVELHGGRMWVESEPGVGTSFHFSLPINAPTAATADVSRWFSPYWHYEPRTTPSAAPVAVIRPRFVVLESGDALRHLLHRQMSGVETVAVTNLDEARQELSRVPAQALLVNGASVGAGLQELTATAELPSATPVIVCSVPGTGETASSLGVSAYLIKPISRYQLLAALDSLPSKPRTILIVDDEPEALQLYWRMLRTADTPYRVIPASEGGQALAVARREHPDAILLDLAMPGMDGFQFLDIRRQDPVIHDIPVLVTSARDPRGQPIVSNALAVTQAGGLSATQVVACVEGLSRILSPTVRPGGPAPTAGPSG